MRESEEQFRATFDLAAVGVANLALDGRWLQVNPKLCEILGYSREEMLQRRFQDITHPDDLEASQALYGRLFAGEIDSYTAEKRYFRKDGGVVWCNLAVVLSRDDGGRPRFFIVVIEDITESKRAREALRESEQRFRSLFEGHQATMLLVDPVSGAILDANEAAVEFYGFSKAELCAMNITQINQLPREEIAEARKSILERRTNGFVFPHRLHSGEIRTVQVYSSPIVIEGRTVLFSIVHDITERKRAEDKLKQMNEYLKNIFANSPDGIGIVDKRGKFIKWNKMAAGQHGYTFEELGGKSAFDLYADKDELDSMLWELRREGAVKKHEVRMKKRDGTVASFEISISLLRDPANEIIGSVCVARDLSNIKKALNALEASHKELRQEIAVRVQAEVALRGSRRELEDIIDFLPDATFVINSEGKVIGWNKAMEEMTGVKASDMLGKGNYEYALPLYGKRRPILIDLALKPHEEILSKYTSIVRTETSIVAEAYIPSLGSGKTYLCGTASCLRDSNGNIVGAIESIRDLSERKQAEEKLAEEANRRRVLFEQSRDGIVILDQTGKVYEANQRFAEMLGYSVEEISGLHIWDWDDNWSQEELLERMRFKNAGGSVFETRHRRKDGTIYDVEISSNRVELGGQKLVFCACRDISQRKRAEEALRVSEERLKLVLTASEMGVWEWDLTADTVFWSPECYTIFGVKSFDGKIASFTDLVHPEDLDRVLQSIKQAIEERTVYKDEFRIIQPGGNIRWVSGLGQAEYDEDGKPIRLIGNTKDITERNQAERERDQLEAQMRQSQKMEALGTLAGGIAHDFNNILGIILGFTELAKLESGEGSPMRENFDEVLKAAKRAKELVKQILAFSRRTDQEKMPFQLELIVKEALKVLRPSLPSTIEIKAEVLSKATVLADPTRMHQVLMNLCSNSAHAMQDQGGVLEVRLTDVMLEGKSLPSHAGLKPGPYVVLTVKDSGCGIDPAVINSIFDPFFTTKGLGEGTGLGLSVVHGIVKSYEGKIDVESEPGKGTMFTVLIPALNSECVPKEVVAQTPLPQGYERVLVVDDEPQLARAVQRMLKTLRYDVVTLSSGTEALEVLCHQPIEERFDLVITDMTMPHFTGADLARELRGLQFAIPVILMTGFSKNMDKEKAKSLGIQGFLMKPVGLEKLAKTVREVLDLRVKYSAEADLQAI